MNTLEKIDFTKDPIAKFEKVSMDEWIKTFKDTLPDDKQLTEDDVNELTEVYENIKLPTRATTGSAGYDFFMPIAIPPIIPGASAMIPTGIKCRINPGWVLLIMPKSGLGTRYKMKLDNTTGVIDSDYYNCEKNEGHIMVAFSNELPQVTTTNPITQKPEIPKELILQIPVGKAFVQGVFVPHGVAEEAEVTAERTGGLGSTNS